MVAGTVTNSVRTGVRPTLIRRSNLVTNRFNALLAAVLLVTALAACSSTESATPDAAEPSGTAAQTESAEPSASEAAESEAPAAEAERVRIDGSEFDPAEMTIAAGTEVQFVNADGFAHTVTEGTDGQAVADPIVDEEIAQNGTVSVTFDEPGTYDITCEIHPSMNMTITVEG
jgi:plastocyanin